MTFLWSPVPLDWDKIAKPLPDGWIRCGYCCGTGVQVDRESGQPQPCTLPECRGGVMRPSGVF